MGTGAFFLPLSKFYFSKFGKKIEGRGIITMNYLVPACFFIFLFHSGRELWCFLYCFFFWLLFLFLCFYSFLPWRDLWCFFFWLLFLCFFSPCSELCCLFIYFILCFFFPWHELSCYLFIFWVELDMKIFLGIIFRF